MHPGNILFQLTESSYTDYLLFDFSLYKVSPISNLNLQIGQYIASNGGVVAAEELAPYLDLQTTNGAMV